ncbi:MAG TPA: hypothetical protein DCL44_07505 [Elusimicrobia bacterium]|nr:hypothetical protein [Elusimicrobiota bacterium]
MAITCNFDKDNRENRKSDKMIVRIPPIRNIGKDTPVLKPVTNGAYLWLTTYRDRSGKSWRDPSSIN